MSVSIQVSSGEKITADKEVILIGRDDTCDICLSDPAIQPRHARIEKISGRWLVKSEGDWELQVNDDPKGSMGWLNDGDTVILTDDGTHLIFEPRESAQPIIEKPVPPPLPNEDIEEPHVDEEARALSKIVQKKKRRISISGLEVPLFALILVIFILAGAFFVAKVSTEKRAELRFAEAQQLWNEDKKEEAVVRYRQAIDFLSNGGRLTTAYLKVIEHHIEKGELDDAEAMLDEAERNGVTIKMNAEGDAEIEEIIKDRRAYQIFREANTLWDEGDKAIAADKYRTLVNKDLERMAYADLSMMMRKVVEYDANNDRLEPAKDMLMKSVEHNIILSLESPKAKAAATEITYQLDTMVKDLALKEKALVLLNQELTAQEKKEELKDREARRDAEWQDRKERVKDRDLARKEEKQDLLDREFERMKAASNTNQKMFLSTRHSNPQHTNRLAPPVSQESYSKIRIDPYVDKGMTPQEVWGILGGKPAVKKYRDGFYDETYEYYDGNTIMISYSNALNKPYRAVWKKIIYSNYKKFYGHYH